MAMARLRPREREREREREERERERERRGPTGRRAARGGGCRFSGRAGWQQVKMRRSQSSSHGPCLLGHTGIAVPGERTATSEFPATQLTKQAVDGPLHGRSSSHRLGGRPSPGHLARAMAKRLLHRASLAGEGRGADPHPTTRTPSRKFRPSLGLAGPGRGAGPRPRPCGAWLVVKRQTSMKAPMMALVLDAQASAASRSLSGDDVEAAEVLPRLRERPVGRQHLAAGHAHRMAARCPAGPAGRRRPTRARRLHLRLQRAMTCRGAPTSARRSSARQPRPSTLWNPTDIPSTVMLLMGGRFPRLSPATDAQIDAYPREGRVPPPQR